MRWLPAMLFILLSSCRICFCMVWLLYTIWRRFWHFDSISSWVNSWSKEISIWTRLSHRNWRYLDGWTVIPYGLGCFESFQLILQTCNLLVFLWKNYLQVVHIFFKIDKCLDSLEGLWMDHIVWCNVVVKALLVIYFLGVLRYLKDIKWVLILTKNPLNIKNFILIVFYKEWSSIFFSLFWWVLPMMASSLGTQGWNWSNSCRSLRGCQVCCFYLPRRFSLSLRYFSWWRWFSNHILGLL